MSLNTKIIDTFPDFQRFWDDSQRSGMHEQLQRYEEDYLKRWPELFETLRDQSFTWREVAEERVLPYVEERYPLMLKARNNLLRYIPEIHERSMERLGMGFPVSFVLHVGIGSAGWAHFYEGRRAVLHDLDMMAQERWVHGDTIKGLVAHELGHHYHLDLRERKGQKNGHGPLWDIYEEGTAQRCEHIILKKENWHMKDIGDDWLGYCEVNIGYLAGKYLRWMEEGKNTNEFFGNWFEIDGYSMVGYYLGHEVIKKLEGSYGLDEISVFPLKKMEREVKRILEDIKTTTLKPSHGRQ